MCSSPAVFQPSWSVNTHLTPHPTPTAPHLTHLATDIPPLLLTRSFLEAKEAFALFDKRGAQSIPQESLGDVLRALGQNPTQKQVQELAATTGPQSKQHCWTLDNRPLLISPSWRLQSATISSCLSSSVRVGSSPLAQPVSCDLDLGTLQLPNAYQESRADYIPTQHCRRVHPRISGV